MTRKAVVTVFLGAGLLAGAVAAYALAQGADASRAGAAPPAAAVAAAPAPSGADAQTPPRTPPRRSSGEPRPPRPPLSRGGEEAGEGSHGAMVRSSPSERFQRMVQLLSRMRGATFNPAEAGLIAIGGLKDDVPRKSDEIIADLESQLAKTKSLGLRNALRLQLRDLYKAAGKYDKVLMHLRAMVAENDAALAAEEAAEATARAREK